jgi:GT2 family glycosyltransferase/glycosyltransferase involved in cell wall biosynthesis
MKKNLDKIITVLRVDGLMPLVRNIHYKLSISINWGLWNLIEKADLQSHQDLDWPKLVIFTGVPYDDIGGGQRAAQLTRAALRVRIPVLYVYAYPKYNVNKRRNVNSRVTLPYLTHVSIRRLNQRRFAKFINRNTTVIFEIPHPQFIGYLFTAQSRGVRTVFELIDDWNTSLGGEWFREVTFRQFVLHSDLVAGTSRVLVKKLMEMGRSDALYLPNAANEYIFDKDQNYRKPIDLPVGVIALYFGSLYGEWFGWKYIQEAALENNGINFCLIGTKPKDIPITLPHNVYFLGEKRIEELPAYLSKADFCLLPFHPSKIVEAVSPIKVFEYIFMAKPVVSTRIAEVSNFPLVYTTQDEKEFSKTCHSFVDLDIKQNTDKNTIDEFIYQNSWFSRLQKIIQIKYPKNVSVVILIHNNKNIIGRCLFSLFENCSPFLAVVVVVDNACEDSGSEYVAETFPSVRIVRNPINGCSSGRNLGAKSSNGKYIAFFDSDQWFTSGFGFAEALNILNAHGEIGAVGWSAGWLDLKAGKVGGPSVDYFPRRAMNPEAVLKGYRTDITYLGTGGLFIPRAIFESTGGFDPAYDPTSFEDTDLSFSIRKLGFAIVYRDLTGIRHEAHQTTIASENSPQYMELFTKNSQYFLNKWSNYRHYFSKKNNWTF